MVKNRVRHYDIAKGLGIILVVIGHSMIEFGHYIIYMFHMPLFFFISGVFFKPDSNRMMLKKQMRNLLIPMVIFTCVIMLVSTVSDGVAILSWEAPHFRGLIGPLWFLWALFVIILFQNLIVKYLNPIAVLAVSVMFAIFGYAANRWDFPNYLYIYSCMSLLVFYTFGSVSGRYIGSVISRHAAIAFPVSFVALIGLYILSYKFMRLSITDLFSNHHSGNFFVWIVGAMVGIIMVFSASMLIDRIGTVARIISLIGEASLYIFAFHLTVLHLIHQSVINPSDGVEIALVMVTVTACLLSRYPLRRAFPKIFK